MAISELSKRNRKMLGTACAGWTNIPSMINRSTYSSHMMQKPKLSARRPNEPPRLLEAF